MQSVNSQTSVQGAEPRQPSNASELTQRAGQAASSPGAGSVSGAELTQAQAAVFAEALEQSRETQTMPSAAASEPTRLKGDTAEAYPRDQKAAAIQHEGEKFGLADAISNTMKGLKKNVANMDASARNALIQAALDAADDQDDTTSSPRERMFAGGQALSSERSTGRYRSSSFVIRNSRDSGESNISEPFARTLSTSRQIRMAQINLSHLADKVLEHSDIDGDPVKLDRYVAGYVAEKEHISDLEKQQQREQNPSLLDRMRNR